MKKKAVNPAFRLCGRTKDFIPAYRNAQDRQRIMYLEGHGNYTLFYVRDIAQPLLVSRTLLYFEANLPDFIRISKALLINPADIKGLTHHNSRSLLIEFTTLQPLRVSRRRISQVLTQLIAHQLAPE